MMMYGSNVLRVVRTFMEPSTCTTLRAGEEQEWSYGLLPALQYMGSNPYKLHERLHRSEPHGGQEKAEAHDHDPRYLGTRILGLHLWSPLLTVSCP